MVLSALESTEPRARIGPAEGPDHHLLQGVEARAPDRGLPRPGGEDRPAAAPRADRGRHGHQGAGVVGLGDGGAAERGHRRHDPRVAHAAARRRPARRGLRRVRAAAGARAPLVRAERHGLPGLRPHDEHDVPGAGRADPGLRARADAGVEGALRGRREHDAGGDGLRRERPGRVEGREHRHQPAGHGRGAQAARSTSTGSTSRRCKGTYEELAEAFRKLVDDYVETKYPKAWHGELRSCAAGSWQRIPRDTLSRCQPQLPAAAAATARTSAA